MTPVNREQKSLKYLLCLNSIHYTKVVECTEEERKIK